MARNRVNYFSSIITNEYLGKTKYIQARSYAELEEKKRLQLETWKRQEMAQRNKDNIKTSVEKMTEEAKETINNHKLFLKRGLHQSIYIEWNKLFKDIPNPQFTYEKTPPQLNDFLKKWSVPEKSFLERIFKGMQQKRECLEYEAATNYNNVLTQFENERYKAYKEWKNNDDAIKKESDEFNTSIRDLKKSYEEGKKDGVEYVLEYCFYEYLFPEDLVGLFEAKYDDSSKICVISVQLPDINEMPRAIGYKYSAALNDIQEIEMKQKEFSAFYNDTIKQAVLRTIYTAFKSDYLNHIDSIVFNGWVDTMNKANGKKYQACIISLMVNRKQFMDINFWGIDANECIKSLKALYGGDLTQLTPVKPIMQLNKNDSRFIAAKNIIDELVEGANLATMDWEDFEHLVRELFSKYFSSEDSEVKVTRSSRDGGVDAIAFDPDPIRGGKYVIQAKRYNNVVPVSAVRDLYGTMISEGAVKGILVTTSYFGNDSREFVKDKPISLIDGQNLIYMLSKYGYKARIELQQKH